VSAYGAGIFHLMTHAFFKALLFLAAGSVIMAMHHEQDMRHMGGLRKYLPVTYWTSLIGSLALIGFPGFSGFFSKDALIEAVGASHIAGAGYAQFCVTVGVYITALYSFRMIFMTFHGEERMDAHTREHLHESPWVVTVPLVLLAIPSIAIGWFTVGPVLFGHYFDGVIFVSPAHDVLAELGREFEGPGAFVAGAFRGLPLYLAAAGVATAWALYLRWPAVPARIAAALAPVKRLLDNKYWFDWFNENVIAAGSRALGRLFWHVGDEIIIDGALVNGSARGVGWLAATVRHIQSGYLYHYAFAMIIGLGALIAYLLFRT
jgi:NADH-quinone oxidoreductase subunit L